MWGLMTTAAITATRGLAADAAGLPPVALADVLAEAQAHNPAVAAARARAEALDARVWSAASPAQVMVEHFHETEVSGMRDAAWTLRLDMPFPGRTWFSGLAASRMADAAQASSRAVALDVRARVTIAYAALAREDLLVDAIRSSRDLMRQAAAIAQARVSGNQAGTEDMLLAQAEAAKADVMLTMELNARVAAEAELAALLRRPAERAAFGVATPLPLRDAVWSATELVARARGQSPRLAAAERDAAAASAGSTGAAIGVLPSLAPFYTHKAYDGGGSASMLGIGVSYPLFFWAPALEARAASREASAAARTEEVENAEVARTIQAELSEVRSHVSAARDYRDVIVPLLGQAVASAQASYAGGKGDILKLLESARSELEARQEAASQTAHAAEHWVNLETAVGGPLEEVRP